VQTTAINLSVSEAQAGQSLGALVAAHLGAEAGRRLLARGGVWLDRARVLDAALPLHAGAQVSIIPPPSGAYSDPHIEPDDICYEDKWLLALNKRAGWYVTPTPWDAYGNVRVALTRFLRMRDGPDAYLHLLHQLDCDTTGVLLCSKNPEINAVMQVIFEQGGVYKEYVGVCAGEVSADSFEMRSGHGRGRKGLWRLYDLEQVGTKLPNGKYIKLAHTSFTVQQRMPQATIVRAVLHTGRTHQIRLHLAALGHPLLGDKRYGGPLEFRGQLLDRHLLHAACMRLEHPVTGAVLEVQASPPDPMAALIARNVPAD
jgi:23S rRNA pseudouridine1911/1915/1917 synthase